MKTKEITIKIGYGSDFQEEVFDTLLYDMIFNIGCFIQDKHKKNHFEAYDDLGESIIKSKDKKWTISS